MSTIFFYIIITIIIISFILKKKTKKKSYFVDFFWSNEIDFFNIMFRLSERAERK